MAIQHESQNAPRTLLVEARLQKGWSQRELADQVGTTYVNISRWERNQTRPSPYFRSKLCKLFGKTEEELDLDAAQEDELESSPVLQNAPVVLPSNATRPAHILDPRIPQRSIAQLVGRDAIFASLKARLCSTMTPDLALTALNGLPGVGKTTLSLALAYDEDIRKRFTDGILWAGLGPEPNLTQHLSHWGTLLDATNNEAPQDNRAWARALTKALGDRSMLIVLDDAWQIEDALALKIGGPNCAHLITTRFPALAYEIAPYGAVSLSELNEQDGLDLLQRLAPRVVHQEHERAEQLVKAVGGLPLALTLMGKFLHVQSNTNQPRRIRATLERLNDVEQRMQLTELRGPNEQHTSLPENETSLSLDSVITVTGQMLDVQTRNALYMLSVFPPKPDSFSEEAALAVMDAPVEILDTLGDVGLLETSAAGRYSLHQTIADYAGLRLTKQLAEAAYEHYLDYTLAFITQHRKDYEKLEQETNVVLTAIDAAYSYSKMHALIQSVIAFAPYLLLRGFYDSAEQYLQRALTAAQHSHDDYGIASALLYLGEIAQKQGNYALAESRFQQGLDLARAIHNPERISTLLNDLGWVTWKQGNYALAETYLQEGLALAREIADDERISSILKTLGSVVGSQGNYAQEKEYLQEGLTLARRLKDDEQICIILINLGVSEGEQGNFAKAEEYFLEGLDIARKIGHKEWISALLSNLGGAASELENYSEAEYYFQEGLAVAKQLGHPEWTSLLLLNLGVTTRKQKKYLQASEYLQEGLDLSQQIDIPQMTSNALYELGNLYLDQQKVDEAELTFRKMIVTTPEGGQDLLALAQYGLARSVAAKGNVEEAQSLGKSSLTMLEEMGHHRAQEVKNWLDVGA
jgi:tetratricopeptide (TPR) repeat protein/transcriptional regulator with XRE-family HTH domain